MRLLLALALAAQATPALKTGELDFKPPRLGGEKGCKWMLFKRLSGKGEGSKYQEVCLAKCPPTHNAVPAAWPQAGGGVCVPRKVKCFMTPTASPFQPYKCMDACAEGKHPEPCDWPKDGDFMCADDR